ncbi:hypothetical protein Hanom_Chr11g01040691 [Helianthus anomalus]
MKIRVVGEIPKISFFYCSKRCSINIWVGVGYKVHFSYKVYKVIKHHNSSYKTHSKPTNNKVKITKTPYLWVLCCVLDDKALIIE